MILGKSRWWIALFFTSLLLTCFFHQRDFTNPTAVSRLDLLYSICNSGQLNIDELHLNTPDKAFANGHYYSDKAPGTAALALPFYYCAHIAAKLLGFQPTSQQYWLITSWAACAGSQALPVSAGLVALAAWLSYFFPWRHAVFTAMSMIFGGMPLAYCTVLFSHAQVFGLLCIVIWLLRLGLPTTLYQDWRDRAAGTLLGTALASEFTAGLVVVGISLIGTRCELKRMFNLLVCAAPFLGLVPVYSWLTLGTPFQLPYSYQASFPEMREGLYGIKWPDLTIAWKLLCSPARGLFYWSPFLVLSLVGFIRLSKDYPFMAFALSGTFAISVLVISGRKFDWAAGISFGPRYLCPAVCLLALPSGLGLCALPLVGRLLAVYSVSLCAFAVASQAMTPLSRHPLVEVMIPAFRGGEHAFSLLSWTGVASYVPFILYLVLLSLIMLWFSFPSKYAGKNYCSQSTLPAMH